MDVTTGAEEAGACSRFRGGMLAVSVVYELLYGIIVVVVFPVRTLLAVRESCMDPWWWFRCGDLDYDSDHELYNCNYLQDQSLKTSPILNNGQSSLYLSVFSSRLQILMRNLISRFHSFSAFLSLML